MARRKTRKAGQLAAARAGATAVSAAPAVGGNAVLVRASYDAAGSGRRLRGWRPPSSGPNRAINGLATLRNRSRDAARNEWTGAATERVWGTNLIGTGIIARAVTKDPALKALYARIWADFCKASDADGVLDFYAQQTLSVEAWRTSGEVFVRFRWRREADGLAVPLQIQLLESDMVPELNTDTWPGLPAGNRIRQGIELDRIGRRAAYWVYREHPGDGPTTGASTADLVRVPAREMRHLFKPLRPGQLRGVPASAPILAKQRSVGNYDDAVLLRQELANLYTLFVTRPPQDGPVQIDPTTGLPIELDAGGGPMVGLEPGLSQELAPGENVTFSDPPDAGANYPDFMRQQHLGIAGGGGTPYELMSGDVRDVSDRALRVVINDFRRTCEQYQWQLVIPMLCQPVREACGQAAALAGLLTPEQAADFGRVIWSPHAWPYIHPTQDVESKRLEIDAGIKSRSAIVAANGDDPEAVFEERLEDAIREQRMPPPADPGEPGA